MRTIKTLFALLFLSLPLCAQTRTQIAADTFVRANSLTLGNNWSSIGQGSTNQPQIVSNLVECVAVSNVPCPAVWAGYPDLPYDQFSGITVKAHANINDLVMTGVRMQHHLANSVGPASYAGYFCGTLTGFSTYGIWRVGLDGSVTQIQTTAVSMAVNDTIILTVQGSTLTCFVNGTQIATIADTTFAAGLTGFFLDVINAGAVGDAALNNFIAGAASNAPTVSNTYAVYLGGGLPTQLGTLTGPGQSVELTLPPVSRNYLGRLQIVADGIVVNPTWVLECTQTGRTTWFQFPASTVPNMATQLGDAPDTYAPFYDVSGLGGGLCRFGLAAGTVTGAITVNAQAN